MVEEHGTRSIALPVTEFCAFLQLPLLSAAGFLSGRSRVQGVEVCGLETILFGARPEKVAEDLKATTLRKTSNVDATAFVRMLAKIGYSFAVSQLGSLPLQQVPVLPLILGRADNGSLWVGSANFETQTEKLGGMHALCLMSGAVDRGGNREPVVLARIKLFASSGATGYEIVVHRPNSNPL